MKRKRRSRPQVYCSRRCHGLRLRIPAEQRFWEKVNKDGPIPLHRPELGPCWEWIANAQSRGYGLFWNEGRNVFAHRFAWESENGPMPLWLHGCHHCDNKRCVRPSHIFAGTQSENIQDCSDKGRLVILRGVDHPGARLTPEQVRFIRDNPHIPLTVLGRKFGVMHSTVGKVRKGVSYRNVT